MNRGGHTTDHLALTRGNKNNALSAGSEQGEEVRIPVDPQRDISGHRRNPGQGKQRVIVRGHGLTNLDSVVFRKARRRQCGVHDLRLHRVLSAIVAVVAPYNPSGHQFRSPASCRSAGPTTIRTTVASISTAAASVNPSILTTRKLPIVNAAKTAIMIAAALVISPAVLANPSITAALSERPRRLSSSTRATRKTS